MWLKLWFFLKVNMRSQKFIYCSWFFNWWCQKNQLWKFEFNYSGKKCIKNRELYESLRGGTMICPKEEGQPYSFGLLQRKEKGLSQFGCLGPIICISLFTPLMSKVVQFRNTTIMFWFIKSVFKKIIQKSLKKCSLLSIYKV